EKISRVRQANLFMSRHCVGWRHWMDTLPGGPFEPGCLTWVDSSGLTLPAATDGTGAAIAVCELAEHAVGQGRLESVFGHPVAAGIGFYLVYPESLRQDRRLDNLRHWLRGQSQANADT